MNKKGSLWNPFSWFGGKVESPKEELLQLEADFQENFSHLEASMQKLFNAEMHDYKNKGFMRVRYVEEGDEEVREPVRIEAGGTLGNLFKVLCKKPIVKGVEAVQLTFKVFTSEKKFYQWYIKFIPVDDNGTHKWAIMYQVKVRGTSKVSELFTRTLNHSKVNQKVLELVTEYS